MMKYLLTLILVSAAIAGQANLLRPAGNAEPVPIRSVIVIPAAATLQEEFAARLLADYLPRLTGGEYRVANDGEAISGPWISVGGTRQFREAGLPDYDAGEVGYALDYKAGNWYISGGSRSGPVTGVLALLEEDGGCRWYAPDTPPTVPSLESFTAVPRRYRPQLQVRDPFFFEVLHAPEWAGMNRTNPYYVGTVPPEFGGRFAYSFRYFTHTFNPLFPVEEFGSSHPEFFPLINGKREISTRVQRCLSQPAMVDIAVEKLCRQIEADPEAIVYGVAQNDYPGGWCECPDCAAALAEEGSYSGPLLRFVNRVADRIAELHPGKFIATLAYHQTFLPPAHERPRNNVIIMLCTDSHCHPNGVWSCSYYNLRETPKFLPALEAWSRIGAKLQIWDYVVDFFHYPLPQPNLAVMDSNINDFVRYGAVGIMANGSYQSPGASLVALKCWVLAKKFWDPSRNLTELARDFVDGYYGTAAPAMQAYLDCLAQWQLRLNATCQYGDAIYLPDAFVVEALSILSQATAAAEGNPELQRRIRREEFCVRYQQVFNGMQAGESPAAYLEHLAWLKTQMPELGITHLSEGKDDNLDMFRRKAQWQQLPPTTPNTVLVTLTIANTPIHIEELSVPEEPGGFMLRQPGGNREWSLQGKFGNVAGALEPDREYAVRIRYRAQAEMQTDREAEQQPLFVFGVYVWGAPVSSNQEVTVSGVADSNIRQATVARVRLASSVPAYGVFYLTPVAETPLKSLDYGLVELIPVNEYPGSLPERLPLLESAGPR